MTKLEGLAWRLGRYAGLPGFESQHSNHVRGPLLSHDLALSNWQRARTQNMNPDTTPEQDKPEPFALDLNDETPLPVICELSEDGTCEACQ